MEHNTNKNFELEKTWNNYDEKGVAKTKRIPVIIDAIPDDITTIIDIGCGNGFITNILSKKYEVTGLDISEQALKNIKTKTICSTSTKINLPDNSFDLVLSSEMIEHLGNDELYKAISEMIRLSNKYILITVPYNENINQSTIKCPKCNYKFHVVGHLQSFSKEKLYSYFYKQFKIKKSLMFGNRVIRYNESLLNFRQNFSGQYYIPKSSTVCPNCNNNEFGVKKNSIISMTCNILNLLTGKRQHYWMLLLLEKI